MAPKPGLSVEEEIARERNRTAMWRASLPPSISTVVQAPAARGAWMSRPRPMAVRASTSMSSPLMFPTSLRPMSSFLGGHFLQPVYHAASSSSASGDVQMMPEKAPLGWSVGLAANTTHIGVGTYISRGSLPFHQHLWRHLLIGASRHLVRVN